jgi:hypothetical protein
VKAHQPGQYVVGRMMTVGKALALHHWQTTTSNAQRIATSTYCRPRMSPNVSGMEPLS